MDENEKIIQLLNDEGFINGLQNIDTMEGLREAFAENGIILTQEEVEELAKTLVCIAKDKEFEAEELDTVVGGGIISTINKIKKLYKWGKKGWEYGEKFCDWMYETFGIV